MISRSRFVWRDKSSDSQYPELHQRTPQKKEKGCWKLLRNVELSYTENGIRKQLNLEPLRAFRRVCKHLHGDWPQPEVKQLLKKRAEGVPSTYRWRRWARFRRHINTETPTGPGTWRSSTWSWSIWEENWRMPSCRDGDTARGLVSAAESLPQPPSGQNTDLDCLFLLGSSAAKMWTVPWSLDTQMSDASWLKLMLRNTKIKLKHLCQRLTLIKWCFWCF